MNSIHIDFLFWKHLILFPAQLTLEFVYILPFIVI